MADNTHSAESLRLAIGSIVAGDPQPLCPSRDGSFDDVPEFTYGGEEYGRLERQSPIILSRWLREVN